jgi:hypothetical protein
VSYGHWAESKGEKSHITPQMRTPWKRGRIILVVICKSTFLDWVVWFQNYGTIICVIFQGGWLIKDWFRRYLNILPILSKNYKKSMGLLWSIYPNVRTIHRSVEIQALYLWEKRLIVFPCDDLGEYDIVNKKVYG